MGKFNIDLESLKNTEKELKLLEEIREVSKKLREVDKTKGRD